MNNAHEVDRLMAEWKATRAAWTKPEKVAFEKQALDLLLRARVQLLFGKSAQYAFFSTLALRLKSKLAYDIPTAAVDGKHLYVNPHWWITLTDPERIGVLVHEVMHCVAKHMARRGARSHIGLMQAAADIAINPLILDAGFVLPRIGDAPLMPSHYDLPNGENFEWYYDKLMEKRAQEQARGEGDGPVSRMADMDDPGHSGKVLDAKHGPVSEDEHEDVEGSEADPSDGKPGKSGKPSTTPPKPSKPQPGEEDGDGDEDEDESLGDGDGDEDEDEDDSPGSDADGESDGPGEGPEPEYLDEAEAHEIEQEWSVAIAQATRVAEATAQRGTMPGMLASFLDVLRAPAKRDWRQALRDFVRTVSHDDMSWNRPNRRYIGGGTYLPALYSESLGMLVLVVDTSGSVPDKTIEEMLNEAEAAASAFPCEVRIIYHHSLIYHVDEWHSASGEPMPRLSQVVRGGTDHRPVFEWIDRELIDPPAAIICLADLWTALPESIPAAPVLWLTYNNPSPVCRFGDIVKMD